MINLSIITVIFNNESSIKKYLQSLTKNLPERSEVILIDNASTDKTVEIIHSFNDKRIKLYGQSKNLGFSKGCNLGAKYAQGKYLLFLNSDIQIIDDGIKKLLEAKIENFKVALVAPKLILTNGHVQASIRKLPTLRGVFEEYFLGKKNSYQEYIPSGNESQVIECAYGAAMLLEKSFFEKVGGFDERYFLYYEDIELCRKIKSLNEKILYIPTAIFKHLVGGSATKQPNNTKGFIKTLSYFVPLEKGTRDYYQVQGRNLYHGILISLLITLIIFISRRITKNNV